MSRNIQIVLPEAAFGSGCGVLDVSGGLRMLTAALGKMGAQVSSGLLGGDDGYGADFENDVFMMHPYCWCERAGKCPWCTGCAIYQEQGTCKVCAEPSLSVEQRRCAPPDQKCDYAAGRGIFSRFHPWTLDHKTGYYDPPNFWYKASNFRVCWYKWIGRDMKQNRPLPASEWASILTDCLASIQKPARA